MSPDIYNAFMLDHAAGALSPGLKLAADLHVALSMEGAGQAAVWDTIGGALLERQEVLAAPALRARRRSARDVPAAMTARSILRTDFGQLDWRRTLTSARRARTGIPGAHFMRLEAGETIPRHGHSALEATIVLEGQLAADGEIFGVGDLMLGLPGEPHKPGAYGEAPCICLVASDRDRNKFWRLT